MRKFKKVVNKISNTYKDYFKRYTATNFGLMIVTFYFMIASAETIENSPFFGIMSLFISSNFMIESIISKPSKNRYYLNGIAAMLSIAIGFVIYDNGPVLNLFYIGIPAICILVGVFFIIKDQKNISSYLIKVFYNLFKVYLFTMILTIGFAIIYLIIETLIIEGYEIEFYDKVLALLYGMYTMPFSIIALLDVKDDVPEIINTLIRRVLLILLDISFVVVLIYILKIVITTKIPQNELFASGALMYFFAMPMFIMLSNYKGKLEEINYKYFPYILFVTIGLQIYSVIVRISTYGLTQARYISIFFIIFEIVALILFLIKKKKYITYSLLLGAVFSLILFILPVVNAYEAPIILQVKRLESIWTIETNESKITAIDRQRIKDIYEFLNERDGSEKYLPKYLTMERINSYLMKTRGEFEGLSSDYYSFSSKADEIYIKDYTTLKYYTYDGKHIELDKLKVTIKGVDYYIKDEILRIMKEENINEIMISIENGDMLYITDMSFYYDENASAIDSFNITGYILSR